MKRIHLFVMAFVGGLALIILGVFIFIPFAILGFIMSVGSPLTLFLHPMGKAEQYEVYCNLPDLRKAHKREIQKKEFGFEVKNEIKTNIPGPVPSLYTPLPPEDIGSLNESLSSN